MTETERRLLLVDFSSRLPYGVKGRIYAETADIGHYDMYSGCQEYSDTPFDVVLDGIERESGLISFTGLGNEDTIEWLSEYCLDVDYYIEDFTPYLRPMSSMTREEILDWRERIDYIESSIYETINEKIADMNDWLNSRHLDYRDLISKGLALEAPEGIYKF